MTAAAAAPKPKVCILAPSYWPAVGGGETHARLLARELSVRGCAVTVLTRRREAEWAAEKKFEGARILRFGKPGHVRLGKYLLLGPTLWWLVTNKRRWDVVCVCGLRVAGWSEVLARKPCVLRAAAFLAVSTPVRDEYLSKGLGFLLRVWKAFHAMCPAAVLLLIGSGGARSLSCEDDLGATSPRTASARACAAPATPTT